MIYFLPKVALDESLEALLLGYEYMARENGLSEHQIQSFHEAAVGLIRGHVHRVVEKDGWKYTYAGVTNSGASNDTGENRNHVEGEKTFGDQMRELRNGTPVEKVADDLHLQIETITRLEQNDRRLKPSCLKRILEYYHVPETQQAWFHDRMRKDCTRVS